MAGDGKTGELGAEREANGPESEPSAPSSRGRRALLAASVTAGVGERSGASHNEAQSSSNTARLALERDIHRLVVVSRQERSSRKKRKTRGAGASPKPVEVAAPTAEFTSSKQRSDETALGDGTALSDVSLAKDPALEDAALADDTSAEDGQAAAKSGAKKKRRRRARPSASSVTTRLLLPVLAAEWEERVAAFKARGDVPPMPYRPTHLGEAFALTANERRALSKDQIRHLNSSAQKVASRAVASVAFLDRWRNAIAQLPVNLQLIDLIDTLARALSHADVLLAATFDVALPEFIESREAVALTQQERLQLILRLTRDARRGLLSEVKRLIDRSLVPRGALSGLIGGAGHYNAGMDLLALVQILESAVASGTHVTFTPRELADYATLAYTLLETTARVSTRRGGAARAAAIEERSRAFTLLWLAHREAYWALASIFRDRLDVSVVLPSLVGDG
jgi:hypothetical protein